MAKVLLMAVLFVCEHISFNLYRYGRFYYTNESEIDTTTMERKATLLHDMTARQCNLRYV